MTEPTPPPPPPTSALGETPAWPVIAIMLNRDPSEREPLLRVDGEPVEVLDEQDPHRVGIAAVAAHAAQLGRPVRALVSDGENRWRVIVHPDGRTESVGEPRRMAAAAPPTDQRRRLPGRLAAGITAGILLLGLATAGIAVSLTGSSSTSPTPATAAPAPSSIVPTPETTAPQTPPGLEQSAPPTSPAEAPPSITGTPPPPPDVIALPAPAPRASPRGPGPATPAPQPAPRRTAPQLAPAPPPPPPAQARAITGQVSNTAGNCLDRNGAAVFAASCNLGGASQTWTHGSDATLSQGTRCLAMSSTAVGAGNLRSNVGLVACTRTRGQQWTRTTAGQLRNSASGLCLADSNSAGANGAVFAVKCSTAPGQRWTI